MKYIENNWEEDWEYPGDYVYLLEEQMEMEKEFWKRQPAIIEIINTDNVDIQSNRANIPKRL